MEQILLHLFGDFIIQNDNVGVRKKEKSLTGLLYCIFHCITYSIPFILITNWYGVMLIAIGHFVIDRWNIIGNYIALKNNVYTEVHTVNETKIKRVLNTKNFGYKSERPFAVTIWLYIIQDNSIHLIWNYLVILYFT